MSLELLLLYDIPQKLDKHLLTVSVTISQAGEFDYSGAC